MNVNRYQFDNIVSKTKKTLASIRRGEEDEYFDYLALIEIRLYQFHNEHGINGRQAKEILQLVLFDIKSMTDQEEYDCSKWEEECYRECADVIEQLFFAAKNSELKEMLKTPFAEEDDYFELARKILIRIHESVEQWTKDFGGYGYFNFIGEYMGSEIVSAEKFLVESRYLKA